MLAKVLGAGSVALTVYYARFFALRQEPFTLVQIVTFLVAATLLLTSRAPEARVRTTWPHIVLAAAALLLGVALFAVVDRTSHSASDTLNGVVPSEALLAALVLRMRYDLAGRRARRL